MPVHKLLENGAIAAAGRPMATTAVHFGHQAGQGWEGICIKAAAGSPGMA